MIKTLFKEGIIILLLCVAIILILWVLFYDYNPVSKVVPNKVAYTTSEDVKSELEENVENTLLDLGPKVYNIEGADLTDYQRSNTYNPSKENPFVNTLFDAGKTDVTDEPTDVSGDNPTSTPASGTTNSEASSSTTPAKKLK